MPAPSGFIHFDIVGNENGVQQMLNHLDSALSPVGLTAFLHGSVEPWLVERAKARFAGEGDDVSGPWAPLAEATLAWRESEGFGPGPINRRTGELEDYITSGGSVAPIGVIGAGLTYPSKGASMSLGLKEKVKTAQVGKSSPSTRPRPVLGMNEKDLAHVMTSLAFFVKGFKK